MAPSGGSLQKSQAADQRLVFRRFDTGKNFLCILHANGADSPELTKTLLREMDLYRPTIVFIQIANDQLLVDELLDDTSRSTRRDEHFSRNLLHRQTTFADDLQRVVLRGRQAEGDALVLDLQVAIGKQGIEYLGQTRRQ